MSNNSNISLTAKNISSYATIGSAFLGGIVGYFIGKSVGPSEPESASEHDTESVSEVESSSMPSAVSSSSSIPIPGTSMGFEPASTGAIEAQQAVLQEQDQVFPNLSLASPAEPSNDAAMTKIGEVAPQALEDIDVPVVVEAPAEAVPAEVPLASLEPTVNPNLKPDGIQGGKMKNSRKRGRKSRSRNTRKQHGGQAAMIVPPSS